MLIFHLSFNKSIKLTSSSSHLTQILKVILKKVCFKNLIFIKRSLSICSSDCVLHDHISHPCVSSSSDIHCETPCTSSSTSHYNACTNKFYYSWLHDPPPCVPLPPDHHFVDHLKAGYYEKDQTKSFIMSNQLKPCQ